MNVLKRDFLQLAKTLFLAAVITLGTSYIFAAWQEPTAAPPGANAEAPVNVSSTGQIKAGALTLNTIGVGTGLIVDKGTAEIHKDAIIGLSTDAIGALRKILSYGNYWGDKYCDRTGGNCIFPGDTSGNPGYVKQIVAGTNVTISPTTGVGVVTINSSGGGSGTDEKVKVTANDTLTGTSPGYLCLGSQNGACGAGSQITAMSSGSVVLTRRGADSADQWVEFNLVGDTGTPPGANKCYQTDAGGNRVWANCPSGGADAHDVKVTADDTPASYLCISTADGQSCQAGSQIVGQNSVAVVRRGAASADQWTQVSLVNDSSSGVTGSGTLTYVYGSNSTGAKGWFYAPAGGGSAYDQIVDEATALTKRNVVRFTGADVTCVDNAAASPPRTDCTITSSGGDGAGGTVYGGGHIGTGQTGYNLGTGWTATMLNGRGLDTDASSAGGYIYKTSSGSYSASIFSDNCATANCPTQPAYYNVFVLSTTQQCVSASNSYKICVWLSGGNVTVSTGTNVDLTYVTFK